MSGFVGARSENKHIESSQSQDMHHTQERSVKYSRTHQQQQYQTPELSDKIKGILEQGSRGKGGFHQAEQQVDNTVRQR